MALREANAKDVPLIVAMLADDALGKEREQLADMTPYLRALEAIQADPHNWQYVWEENGEVLGCLQLTIIPGLSQQGSWHAQIEGVRTMGARRGSGIGKKMMADDHADRPRKGLQVDAAAHQQEPRRRPALLPQPRLRPFARRDEGEVVNSSSCPGCAVRRRPEVPYSTAGELSDSGLRRFARPGMTTCIYLRARKNSRSISAASCSLMPP